MRVEPPIKRAIAFVDGQNLFYAAKQAFGYTYPNYDPLALATAVCRSKGWVLTQTCFYTCVTWTAVIGIGHAVFGPGFLLDFLLLID